MKFVQRFVRTTLVFIFLLKLQWDEWNENEKHGEKNCRDIYDKIENDVYPKTINDMAVSMSIEEVKKEIE